MGSLVVAKEQQNEGGSNSAVKVACQWSRSGRELDASDVPRAPSYPSAPLATDHPSSKTSTLTPYESLCRMPRVNLTKGMRSSRAFSLESRSRPTSVVSLVQALPSPHPPLHPGRPRWGVRPTLLCSLLPPHSSVLHLVYALPKSYPNYPIQLAHQAHLPT